MPWTEKDVKRHKKGLSTSQKKKWARIANAVLDKSNDEVLAIKVANSRTKRMNESIDELINNFLKRQ